MRRIGLTMSIISTQTEVVYRIDAFLFRGCGGFSVGQLMSELIDLLLQTPLRLVE